MFVGGEAGSAVKTFAPSPNRRTILGTPGVDDFVLVGPALDTTHSFLTKLSADSTGKAGFGRKNLPVSQKSFTRSANFGIERGNLKKLSRSLNDGGSNNKKLLFINNEMRDTVKS